MNDELLEIQAEDDPGFAQVGHWVSFCFELSPQARALYVIMCAFVNQVRRRRGDTDVWPSLELLAVLLCLGKDESVTPYMDELLHIGAIVKRGQKTADGMRTRNIYGVRFTPPPGWTGPVELDEVIAAAKEISEQGPEAIVAAAKTAKQVQAAAREAQKALRREEKATRKKQGAVPSKSGVRDDQASNDKIAGQHVPSKSGVRTLEKRTSHPRKAGSNNTKKQHREEEDRNARARATDPTPGPDSISWGVRGGRELPTQADADAIAAIATRCLPRGSGITPAQHQELATALATAVAAVESDGFCSRDEFIEWLGQDLIHADGRPRWRKGLVEVLTWRLNPANYRLQIIGWRARQRAEDPASGPQGDQEPFDLKSKPASPGVCGVHRTTLTPESRCMVCDSEEDVVAFQPNTDSPADARATEDPDEIARIIQEALDPTDGDSSSPGAAPLPRGWCPICDQRLLPDSTLTGFLPCQPCVKAGRIGQSESEEVATAM